MTYDPNIPQPNDVISQSQGQILINFQQANGAFGVDHTNFATVANQGMHKKVTFQSVIPDPNQVSPISSLYTKTVTTRSELFFQNTNAASSVVPITGGIGIGAAAWVNFNGNTGAMTSIFNISSVTRNSTGVYTISFIRNFNVTTYATIISLSGQTNFAVWYEITTKQVGSLKISCFINNGGKVASDPNDVSIVFYGALA